jgi:hypothetical protein
MRLSPRLHDPHDYAEPETHHHFSSRSPSREIPSEILRTNCVPLVFVRPHLPSPCPASQGFHSPLERVHSGSEVDPPSACRRSRRRISSAKAPVLRNRTLLLPSPCSSPSGGRQGREGIRTVGRCGGRAASGGPICDTALSRLREPRFRIHLLRPELASRLPCRVLGCARSASCATAAGSGKA